MKQRTIRLVECTYTRIDIDTEGNETENVIAVWNASQKMSIINKMFIRFGLKYCILNLCKVSIIYFSCLRARFRYVTKLQPEYEYNE